MLKRYSVVFALFVIVIAIVIGVSVDITSRWNNDKYWTYENTISILKQSPGTITRETINGVEVVFEYGLLYSIQTDGDKVKYHFSYEPYDVYQLRIPPNKNPETDLFFTIDTKSDAKPSAFLGRIDKSTNSIKSMGTNSALVTAGKVHFSYSKPKMELQSLWNHYIKAITGKKSDYNVNITSWYVEDLTKLAQKSLNNLTPDRKAELRKKWKEETEKYLVEYHGEEELLSSKYEGAKFIDELSDRFKFENLICRDVNNQLSCQGGYYGIPGINLMMYLYMRNSSGKTALSDKFLTNARSSLFPFSRSTNEDKTEEKTEQQWKHMFTGGFSVCPIVELSKKDYTHKNVQLFKEYYEFFYYDDPKNKMISSKTLTATIKEISNRKLSNSDKNAEMLTIEEESNVDVACYRIAINKDSEGDLLREVNNLYKIIFDNIFTIREKDGNKTVLKNLSMDEFISRSNTAYGNVLLTDYALLEDRVGTLETADEQVTKKHDFKMLLKSYIIMYTYELF